MRQVILTIFTSLLAVPAYAQLCGSIELVEANVPGFEPAADPPSSGDLYEIRISNLGDSPVSAAQLEFFGGFANFSPTPLAFSELTDLPTFGPNRVLESFFVVPPGELDNLLSIPGQTRDGNGVLAAQFTLAGPPRLIPAGAIDQLIAVLTVPVGAPAPTAGETAFEIDGVFISVSFTAFEHFACVPEPAAGLLAVVALVLIPPPRYRESQR